MKTCSMCNEVKNPDDFPNDTRSKDKKAHRCRSCETNRSKQRNAIARDFLTEYNSDLTLNDAAISFLIEDNTKAFIWWMDMLNKYSVASDDCLLWKGAKAHGYAVVGIPLPTTPATSKVVRAHRVAYAVMNGALPESNGRDEANGLTLDHLCGTTNCVAPAHLYVMNGSDNASLAGQNRIPPIYTNIIEGHL